MSDCDVMGGFRWEAGKTMFGLAMTLGVILFIAVIALVVTWREDRRRVKGRK